MGKKLKNNKVYFKDNAIKTINFEDKTEIRDGRVISIRDGVMEYLGAEIGQEPPSKVFRVYRSPDEVKRIAEGIVGIPITDGHIEPNGEVPDVLKHGKVKTFKFIDAEENELNSTLAIEHDIDLSESMLQFIQDKSPESSLGYTGKLIPHKDYDFEQVGITPHHLAVVTSGRCGEICKFKDGSMEIPKNEDGTLDLKAFVEAVKTAMETADDSQKAELSKSFSDMFGASSKEELTDMEKEDIKKEAVEEVKKDDEFMDSVRANAILAFKETDEYKDLEKENFIDSASVKKAIETGASERAEIISKATSFLDADYKFSGKPTCAIMADTLKAEFKDRVFAGNEVAVAFKMLDAKIDESHKDFGDSTTNKWDTAKTKKVGN